MASVSRAETAAFQRVAWFGPLDPRTTAAAAINTPADQIKAAAIAQLKCANPSGAGLTSTVTLVRARGRALENKLLGVAHGLITEDTTRTLKAAGASDYEVWEGVARIARHCEVHVTDNAGRVLEILPVLRVNIATVHPETQSHRDLLAVKIARPSRYLRPAAIRVATARELARKPATMLAYHWDARVDDGYSDSGRTRYLLPKVKSTGHFRAMHPRNPYAKLPNLVLHDLPTGGIASGALLLDRNGIGVAVHRSGINQEGGAYDGVRRFNRAILVTPSVLELLEKL